MSLTNAACGFCESAPETAWRKRAGSMRRELRRHHLSLREMQLAEVILDLTYGWARESIVVPQLQCFTDLTGISKTHVSEGIADLHSMRIIRVVTVKGEPTYSMREDSDNWKVKPRVSVSAMAGSINLVREWNGMAPLPAPLETLAVFKGNPRTVKIISTVPKSGVTEVVPNQEELPHLF